MKRLDELKNDILNYIKDNFKGIIFLIIFSLLNISTSASGSTDQIVSFLLILVSIILVIVDIPTFIEYKKLKKLDES